MTCNVKPSDIYKHRAALDRLADKYAFMDFRVPRGGDYYASVIGTVHYCAIGESDIGYGPRFILRRHLGLGLDALWE